MGIKFNYDLKQQTKSALGVAGSLATGNIFGAVTHGLEGTMGLFGSSSNSAAKAAEQQYQYNLALQQQAQSWNEYMYKNRYQMQVEDLEKAGINKLYGLGNAPSVTTGANSVGMPDMVGEQNNKVMQFIEALKTGQTLSSARAEQKYTEQKTATEIINTQLQSLKLLEQEYNNEMKKIDTKYYDKEKTNYLKKQIAETRYIISETQGNLLDNAPKERKEQFIKENPKLGKALEGIENNKETIGTILGLAIGGGVGLGAIKQKLFRKKVGF